MRCKRHTVDLTSTVGVCASCLHERLLSLAASIAVEDSNNNNNHRLSRKSSNHPPPLPRGADLGVSGKALESKGGKVSRISNPFRARSDSNPKPEPSSSSSSTSRSWISSFLSTGRSKKQPTTMEDLISGCRGMSPARDAGGEDGNEVPSGSIEEETPGRTRRTTPAAMKTPGRRKIMTGMGFCLSPLVRARPNCPFKRKSRFPSEFVGNAGEVTAGEKPHISEAASFCANRSKKLADLGRGNHRR